MLFYMIREANGIEHCLTYPNHPWRCEDQKTIRGIVLPRHGQAKRISRKIKDATMKRFPYESHDQWRSRLGDFMETCTFARRLKTLGGLTAYEYVWKIWASEPDRITLGSTQQM